MKCVSQKSSKELYAYGGKQLTVLGTFRTDIQVDGTDRMINTEFYVIEEEGPGILCKDSATELGLLKVEIPHVNMNTNMNTTDRKSELQEQFPKCFSGIGKLENYVLKIPIDHPSYNLCDV